MAKLLRPKRLGSSSKLWMTFALPRMLYGLEVVRLSPAEISKLDGLRRSTIRRLQSLPQSTAITTVYVLLGVRPIEQEMDLRKVFLLVSVHKYSLPNFQNYRVGTVKAGIKAAVGRYVSGNGWMMQQINPT